ncbi:MAG: hypothetical protein RLZZ293_1391 [Pseudomonadota bacterium]
MDLLVIWLIITPLFFIFGWVAGRIDMKVVLKQAKRLPNRVYDSIDALVNHNTSIARDELKQIIEQEPQLVELQFSLGNLYRKRGENDLAIKLHSKLLSSQYIFSNDVRDKIRLELAHDFQKAGLIDRAETLLVNLASSERYAQQALQMLLLIYQQDKNWLEAIETAKKLATSDISFYTELAQFSCELAQEAMIKSAYEQAQLYIEKALQTNRKCVRANMLLGDIYYNQQQFDRAISTWQQIEKQNYQYLSLMINKIFDAYLQLGKIREGLTLITGYAQLYPQLNIQDIIYQKLANYASGEETLEYLRNAFAHNPNARTAALIIEAQAHVLETSDGRNDAGQIRNLLLKYNNKLSHYHCGCCSFKSKTFFWQCPACYSWESISPNIIEK